MMPRQSNRSPVILLLLALVLLVGGVSAGVIISSHSYPGFPRLIDATLETLQHGLESRRYTSVDLVQAYIARIAEVNRTVHAVTEVNPDALAIAAKLDEERLRGSVRGPLHGIPILVKNNIATFDAMSTTAGSWALSGAKVSRDATVAAKLRSAGAILLGKTNLSQWANFRSFNTSNGWSAFGGQTYAPYFPHEDPEGSSSGSAVSSALGLALAAIGTETDGSIVDPASYNNVVGIKPTVGLTSRHLVIPISEHQDTVGPLARTVKDAAQILQAIAGADPLDNYTSAIPAGPTPNYLEACRHSALGGARIGVPRNVVEMNLKGAADPIAVAFEGAIATLQKAGAVIVDNCTFPAAEEFAESDIPATVLDADFLVNLHSYLNLLEVNPSGVESVADLLEYTHTHPIEHWPERDTGVWERALKNWNNTDPRFWPVYQKNLYFGDEGGLLGALRRYELDAVILPSAFSSSYAAVVGAPIVSVPLGAYPPGTPVETNSWGIVEVAPNVPFGLSFLGGRWSEAQLIGFAYAYEQRTQVRDLVQPYLVPATEIADILGAKKPGPYRPHDRPRGPSGRSFAADWLRSTA